MEPQGVERRVKIVTTRTVTFRSETIWPDNYPSYSKDVPAYKADTPEGYLSLMDAIAEEQNLGGEELWEMIENIVAQEGLTDYKVTVDTIEETGHNLPKDGCDNKPPCDNHTMVEKHEEKDIPEPHHVPLGRTIADGPAGSSKYGDDR